MTRWPANRLAVLTYHRIGARDGSCGYPGLVSATPGELDEQVRFLVARCHPVSADDILAARRTGAVLPPRSVLVTFDDAYADFADSAWPVLRAHRVPVVLFVPTGFPAGGRSFWWDRLYHALRHTGAGTLDGTPAGTLAVGGDAADGAFRALRAGLKGLSHDAMLQQVAETERRLGVASPPGGVLDWDRLRRLHADGVTLAPHSVSHPLLTRVPVEAAAEEIRTSMAELRAQTGASNPLFAYPSGAHDDPVVEAARASGVEIAFTTQRGVNDLRRVDWLRVRRINVGRAGLPVLRAQMHPWASRHTVRRPVATPPAGRF